MVRRGAERAILLLKMVRKTGWGLGWDSDGRLWMDVPSRLGRFLYVDGG